MIKLIVFTTEAELSKLTGLNHNELWDNGFDLDDWDIGFQLSTSITETNLWWLEQQMENYACGYREVEYKNKYYYMVYHS